MKDKEKKPARRRTTSRSKKTKAHLLGLDLSQADGHKRITRSDKFTLLGGSEKSHEAMTESVVKTFESLKKKGRTLETADPREVAELLQKHYPKV